VRTVLATTFVLLVALPAFAETTPDAAGTGAATTEDPLDKIVCKTQPPVVGSRLGATRLCATQREWNQRQADSQKALTDSQTHTYSAGDGH